MTKTLDQHARAKQWRLAIGLTVPQLAEATGFAERSIYDFEAGRQNNGKPIDARAFRRFRLACAAINARAEAFDF